MTREGILLEKETGLKASFQGEERPMFVVCLEMRRTQTVTSNVVF
jgi:hypothetical protein